MGCGGAAGAFVLFYIPCAWFRANTRGLRSALSYKRSARGACWVASMPVDIHRNNHNHNSLGMKGQVFFAKQGLHSYQVVQDFGILSINGIFPHLHKRSWSLQERLKGNEMT